MVVLKIMFLILLATINSKAVKYKKNQEVTVFVNIVGPYHNTHETYHYYQLPFCRPEKIVHKSLSIGELIHGDRMAFSLYKINFMEEKSSSVLCNLTLSRQDVEILQEAIQESYYFEFYIEDLPLINFIGEMDNSGGHFIPHKHYEFLYLHHHFNIYHNEDEIVYGNISTTNENSRKIKLDDVSSFPLITSFSYSVSWIKTKLKKEEFNTKGKRFFPETFEIHWLSIINSVVLIFLLNLFVIFILARVLNKDFARYSMEKDEMLLDDEGEDGWKILHSDVFRFPKYKSLLCAILGVGSQFLMISLTLLLMTLFGLFNIHKHGSINYLALVLYAFTSGLSGYVAGNMYKKMNGDKWVWNINLTSALFTGPFLFVWSVMNTLSWMYGSTQALPWTTIAAVAALWIFVGYPLTIVGGIIGKNTHTSLDFPCRTKNIPREIPRVPCYKGTFSHCLVGGFLPFSAISVELYYIFATVWGHEQYTLYGVLGIVFLMLLSVTICVSVTLTYFLLSSEDYRWWWRSIVSSGSAGIYILLYSIYFYTNRSNMSGLLQATQFFGSTLLICYIFFLMLGTVAFFSSLKFVLFIYRYVKID